MTGSEMSINFLTIEEIVRLHEVILNGTGGEHGILNIGHIDFTVDFLKDPPFSPVDMDIFHLAAILVRNIISGHPFVDGNKRSGMGAAYLFLWRNGYSLEFEIKAGIELALAIAQGKSDVDSIRDWLKQHSSKTSYIVKDGVVCYGGNLKDPDDFQKRADSEKISEETLAIIKEYVKKNEEFLKELAKY